MIHIIDILVIGTKIICCKGYTDSPHPFRDIPEEPSVFYFICQIYDLTVDHIALDEPGRCHADQFLFIDQRLIDRLSKVHPGKLFCHHQVYIQTGTCDRTCTIRILHHCIFSGTLRILCRNQSVCLPGRKMCIIQDPDFHPPFFSFIQNDIKIMPPACSSEIRMGTGFQTYCAYPAVVNFFNFCTKYFFALISQPEKWHDMIIAFSGKNFI